jgi:hypothetical protein
LRPQALGQCRRRTRELGMVATAYADTASAAAAVVSFSVRIIVRSP